MERHEAPPIRWQGATDRKGQVTEEFIIEVPDRGLVTGALWQARVEQYSTLVCMGHGASGNRYQAPISELAIRFSQELGVPVLSLDGPVHGLRQQGNGGREAFFPHYQRAECIAEMLEDWNIAISSAIHHLAQPIDDLAYFGLSMGSIFGIPLIASRQDFKVAAIGLIGSREDALHGNEILDAAQQTRCPVLFLMQLEDELFDRGSCLNVFDRLASTDKHLHANPGLHPQIPAEEIDYTYQFIARHIAGTAQPKILDPIAE